MVLHIPFAKTRLVMARKSRQTLRNGNSDTH